VEWRDGLGDYRLKGTYYLIKETYYLSRDLLKETYYLEWRDGLGEGWVCYLPQYLYISLVKHFKSKINEDGGGPVNLFLDFIL